MFDPDAIVYHFKREFGGTEPLPIQYAMILMIDAYFKKEEVTKGKQTNMPEPLYLGPGMRSGSNMLHLAIKKAYPNEVVSVLTSCNYVTDLNKGLWETDYTIIGKNMAGKTVIFDQALHWHSKAVQDELRKWCTGSSSNAPQYTLVLGC